MADSPKNRDANDRIPDIRALKEFAESTDRETPVAFVGREEQIGALARDLERRVRQRGSWKGFGDPPKWEGATWLFQGAPGAGKTALLRHLQNLKIQAPAGDGAASGGVPVRACSITDQHVLSDPWELKKKIAAVWVPEVEKDLETRQLLELGADLKVIRGGRKTDRPLMSWGDVLKKVLGKPGEYPPLLLMVDEAQKLDDAAEKQVLWLHQGNDGLPIVPVFGGLAWTKERFGELGISRFSGGRVHTLEALSEDDCREVVKAFFGKFDVAGVDEEGERWKDLIAQRSQGWPQHLHAGLQALARGLVKEGVDGDLKQADEEAVLQGEAERRKRYYRDRLGSGYLKSKRHLAAVAVARLDEFPQGATLSRMAGAVQEISDRAGGAGAHNDLALPKGMDAADFVDGMMKSGILHEDSDGYLSVPIPSFRDFLIERYPAPDRGAAPGTGNPPSPAP